MQEFLEGTPVAVHEVENQKTGTASACKIAANRQNALKSTGPKTVAGKAFIRKNAIKHGLFARSFMDFVAHGEHPQEYHEFLEGLRDNYEPIGKAEELEVEHIAICWWKRKRLSRYEHALNRVALADGELRKLTELLATEEKKEMAVLSVLDSAMEEPKSTGEISPELKQKMSTMPTLEAFWPFIEKLAREGGNLASIASAEERRFLATSSVMEGFARVRRRECTEAMVALRIIPDSDNLDKILRYETALDRSLTRSLDRLDRLQRRRKGEVYEPLHNSQRRPLAIAA